MTFFGNMEYIASKRTKHAKSVFACCLTNHILWSAPQGLGMSPNGDSVHSLFLLFFLDRRRSNMHAHKDFSFHLSPRGFIPLLFYASPFMAYDLYFSIFITDWKRVWLHNQSSVRLCGSQISCCNQPLQLLARSNRRPNIHRRPSLFLHTTLEAIAKLSYVRPVPNSK